MSAARKLIEKARIGEVLVQMGVLNSEEIETALKNAKEKGVRLGQWLVAEGRVSETTLAKGLAIQFALQYIDPKDVHPQKEALEQIPYKIAKENKILPIELKGNLLKVVVYDPLNAMNISKMNQYTQCEFEILVSPETHLVQAIEKSYSSAGHINDLVQEIVKKKNSVPTVNVTSEEVSMTKKEGSVEALINRIIEQAILHHASDIHVEPDEQHIRIRERIDGLLMERSKFPIDIHSSMISRLKIMANLDIAEKRQAQDGKFRQKIGPKMIDFRISTLPTVKGEKVVLRILDKSNLKINLNDLGLNPHMNRELMNVLAQPYGIILVSGPTGSGKTTTVYSMLNYLNTVERNIITVEDPVEYQFPIINQVQVNQKVNLTFASVLRNILRQDPDVIMVGEIRDKETAEIAIRAALTGHLVISTIHTNNALTSVSRLVDMGIEPFLISSSLLAVISQRLVRKWCLHCRNIQTEVPIDAPAILKEIIQSTGSFYKASGCPKCNQTGYSGRAGVFELLVPTEEIRAAINDQSSPEALLPLARKNGFITMYEDGVERVKNGLTAIEEILRVIL